MKEATVTQQASISTLYHEFIPRAHQGYGTMTHLIDVNPRTIACVYSHKNGLSSVTFDIKTRKPFLRMASTENTYPAVDSDTFVIKENNQFIIVLRWSESEFHMLSVPWLRVIRKFTADQSTDSELAMCYMNKEIITWFDNGDLISFWELMSTTPSSTLKLPFAVGSTYSQLTNRNLLILQNEESSELAFVDVAQKKIVNIAKVQYNLYHSINSENRIFRYWITFTMDVQN